MQARHLKPKKGGRRAGALVACVSAALAILVPSAASGAGLLRYATSSGDAPPNSNHSTLTPCSGQFKFLAGGGLNAEFGNWFLIGFGSMRPLSDGFLSTVHNFDQNSSIPTVDTAICSSAKTAVRTKRFSLPGNGKVHSGVARCKSGETVLSGGFNVGAPDGPQAPIESYPVDDGDRGSKPDDAWKASAVNFGASTNAKAFAVCMKSSKVKVGYVKDKFTVADGETETPRSNLCGNNHQRVVGGGVRETDGKRTLTGIHASFPFDYVGDADTVPDDGWDLTMDGTSSSGPVQAVIYTVCVEPR